MVQANDLNVGYRGVSIISDINLTLNPGELTLLIGANGSGKSTLLRALAGSQQPLSGEVLINGLDIRKMSSLRLAKSLAVVLTERHGAGGLTVEELVSIGRNPYYGLLGRLTTDDRDAVLSAINEVNLTQKKSHHISTLSDGERQKAMIARAIAQATPLIILDEPTSFLDVASRFEIMRLLARLARENSKTIILSTHDVASAIPVADRICAVADGQLFCGKPDELASTGVLDRVFRGLVYDRDACDFRPLSDNF